MPYFLFFLMICLGPSPAFSGEPLSPESPTTTPIVSVGLLRFSEPRSLRPCLTSLFQTSNEKGKWFAAPAISRPNRCSDPAQKDGHWSSLRGGKPFEKLRFIPAGARFYLNEKACPKTLGLLKQNNARGVDVLAATADKSRDPQEWRRSQPTEFVTERVKREFLTKFEFQRTCSPVRGDPPWATVTLSIKKMNSSHVNIDERAFISNEGNMIVGAQAKSSCLTDPYLRNPFYQKHWYFVTGSQVKEIAIKAERNLEPIDAVDFDGDGRSEWVFRSDAGGPESPGSEFILFSDRLVELARAVVATEPLTTEGPYDRVVKK